MIAEKTGLPIRGFNSGPLGGDQQIGARIVDGKIDLVIFFSDPLEAQPHDPDVKALLRIAQVFDIPIANNRATADFIINSKFMDTEYTRKLINSAGTWTCEPRNCKMKRKKRIILLIILAALLICAAVPLILNAVVISSTKGQIREITPEDGYETALILGAKVHADGTLSDMLRDRMDAGIALYRSGAVKNSCSQATTAASGERSRR